MLSYRNLSRLSQVLKVFRTYSDTISASMVHVFLAVAAKEGCGQVDIIEATGIPQTTLSRQLLDLGKLKRDGAPGLNLVDWVIDPNELRRKKYSLTPKGRKLLEELGKAMEG